MQEFQEDSSRLRTYLQSLADKLNSNEEFEPDDTFSVELTVVRTPGRGGGGGRNKAGRLGKQTIGRLLKTKRSIIEIKNKDKLCCARAIVTMKALADAGSPQDPDYRNLRKGLPVQEKRAKELYVLAQVPEAACGIPELDRFQQALPDYQIKVLSVDKPHMVIFAGPAADKKILLVKVDHHYHGCNSFAGFLERSYFCHERNRGYNTEDYKHHACDKLYCPSCRSRTCASFQAAKAPLSPGEFPKPTVTCPQCNRRFFEGTCYDHHHSADRERRSLCDTLKQCLSCRSVYDAAPSKKSEKITWKHKHRCGWGECPFCFKQVDQNTHKCYIQPVDPEEDEPEFKKVSRNAVGDRAIVLEEEDGVWVQKNKPLFVYADYEATTDEQGLQTPILLCCETEEEEETQVFYGEACTDEFFLYLDDLSVDAYGDDRQVIVIFHNFKGYDGMFILKYLYENHRDVEDQVTVGTKVLSLRNGDITFKDSLCFLPFPLASFPATFGLTELCKGFFPHLFNTKDRQTYEGPMPDISFYDPDGMSAKKKAEFLTWHAQKVAEEYTFNLQHEMQQYCISDVKLLKAGCQKFQEEFQSHASFKPMEKCITIASACNRFWRKMLLPADTIAVEPPRGWFGAQTNTSRMAREWFAYQNKALERRPSQLPEEQLGLVCADRIRHANNGGEVRIFTPARSFLVDGFDEQTNTVYEFNGCLWHGCPQCYPYRHSHSKLHADRTFQELFEATESKRNLLTRLGYTVNTMWECRWKWQKQHDEQLRAFLQEWQPVRQLDPRDAFFGGRTNAVKLYHRVGEGEKIHYVDVTSLYPWVNATATYPVGHPVIISNPTDQEIHSYFGVALIDILPPQELFHPVLPHGQGGKLTFPLCAKCVQDEMVKPMLQRSSVCEHLPAKRTLRGTWCTPEIVKALQMGYRVIRIHEVWHFPKTKTGLFADYVRKWLKVKQESAGYPTWAVTEEQKQQYRENYNAHEGVQLEADKIAKNPGRKATAKLMLNSFWGKFGENLNKPKVHSITDPAALFQLVELNIASVEHIRVCTPDLLEVVVRKPLDNQLDNGKRNIFIAAFTTCYARLKLYESLEKLKEQLLYFDTDSVIYSCKPGQPTIELGDYLGDMTNELDSDEDYIEEFVSGGPKNYGYTTNSGKVTCKVRGFTLNVRGSQQLNYEVMKRNVLEEILHPLEQRRLTDVNNPHFFTRHPETKRLRVVPRTKQYGLVFDKRVIDTSNFRTFPYGYHKSQDEVNVDTLLELL